MRWRYDITLERVAEDKYMWNNHEDATCTSNGIVKIVKLTTSAKVFYTKW